MNRITTLLISGQNNHDWPRTTRFFHRMLEQTGKFNVEVTERPESILANWEQVQSYKLLMLDYFGEDWGDAAKGNFCRAVEEGAGLVIIHAANNGFRNWIEFEQMAGLVFRNEQGSAHGHFHKFAVTITNHEHPVTRKLENFTTWDELYHHLIPSDNKEYQVLASAYSDPAMGGSGKTEPVMLALEYGKGRIFHMILGHVWPGQFDGEFLGTTMMAVENIHFQNALLNGCEWAATCEVTS